MLARVIAYRVQEQRLGKLSREMRKLLDRLVRGGAEPPRHLKVGTVMVREHQGTLHEVMVYRAASPGKRRRIRASPHRPSHHRHVLEWTPLLRPSGRERHRGSGRARSRHEELVLEPQLHPIQRARIAGHAGSAMKMANPKPLRCAIYTRKSTEHNLDLAFNSLDAQREACEAYIKSQAHEGWRLLPERYDDGGLSGASLERPALQLLLTEVKEGRVDVIVVYKVDRLTRSLADFAKLVETFDHMRSPSSR